MITLLTSHLCKSIINAKSTLVMPKIRSPCTEAQLTSYKYMDQRA